MVTTKPTDPTNSTLLNNLPSPVYLRPPVYSRSKQVHQGRLFQPPPSITFHRVGYILQQRQGVNHALRRSKESEHNIKALAIFPKINVKTCQHYYSYHSNLFNFNYILMTIELDTNIYAKIFKGLYILTTNTIKSVSQSLGKFTNLLSVTWTAKNRSV